MPNKGLVKLPPTASISNEPTMGPVQLNETSTKVNAIKNTPINEPMLLLESTELTNWWGKVISNIPKNEEAKTMNMIKKSMLGTQ